ncbi:MAG: gfo/Idh/MocA family oxidoreductase [Chlorobi bacterium CHB2]|nr:gfo/Idh/MocA family oxidoreductase [Chlorobi bacterium CHB2]
MTTLRTGVIGVGHLGAIHARLWKGVQNGHLVGVFDPDTERAQAIAAEHEVECFTSVEELLGQVDAVSIVAPTSDHAAIAHAAIGAGVHCFIEKPITAQFAEAVAVIDHANQAGITLQVGHVERFNPAFLALAGYPLEPMFIESHRLAQFKPRATDVAVVLDLMIHDIDLILHIVKSPVTEVRASGVAVATSTIDIANARLEFANGCVANITASRISQRPMRKLRMFQRDSYISLDFAKPSVEIFRIADGSAADIATGGALPLGQLELGESSKTILFDQPTMPQVNAIQMELQTFTDAILHGGAPAVTAADGAEALRIAELIINTIEGK